MRITVHADDLRKALRFLNPSSMPRFGGLVKLDVSGSLTVSTFTALTYRAAVVHRVAASNTEHGTAIVAYSNLVSALALWNGDVTLFTREGWSHLGIIGADRHTVDGGRQAGRTFTIALAATDDEYPATPVPPFGSDLDGFSEFMAHTAVADVPYRELRTMTRFVEQAALRDETFPLMMTVAIAADGDRLRMIATDRYSASDASVTPSQTYNNFTGWTTQAPAHVDATDLRKAVNAITDRAPKWGESAVRLFQTTCPGATGEWVGFATPDRVAAIRRYTVTFPEFHYGKLTDVLAKDCPPDTPPVLTVGRKDFYDAVCHLRSGQATAPVTDGVNLKTEPHDNRYYVLDGPGFEFRLRADNLYRALKATPTGEVVIHHRPGDRAARLETVVGTHTITTPKTASR